MNTVIHTPPTPSHKSVAQPSLSFLHRAVCASLIAFAAGGVIQAQETKVQLEEPKQTDLLTELKESPDGVLRVKTSANGGFESLVVKSSVEVEDVLGGEKGKRMARKDAEIQCKRLLSQWLEENCVFAEMSNNTRTIITKGESTKDAAGNTVNIRNQQGTEVKVLSESSAAASQAVLRGLNVVVSEIPEGSKELVLIMALTQKSLNQSNMVGEALSTKTSGGTQGSGTASDRPAPETKVNKALLDELR